MNTKVLIGASTVLLLFFACKQKAPANKEDFFPVVPFLKSQVAQMDTSLASITRYVFVDSTRTDTFYIPREQFRAAARDFLAIPDISKKEFRERFKEDKMFDETLNSVLLTYTPIDPASEQVQREEVLIKPNPSGDKITNIIINLSVDSKDSSVQKRMLWQVDNSFQVVTTRRLAGQPETTTTEKVIWGENEEE